MAHTAHSDPEMARERFDSAEELAAKVDRLAALVARSQHFVAFTGAGISTSAGIPDFRGPQGKWTREAQGLKPIQSKVSTVSALPTPTHMMLVELQRRQVLKYLISQNCDGLHRRSGIAAEGISELHGNSNVEVCEDCGQSYLRDLGCHRYSRGRDHLTGRFCAREGCGGPLLEYTIDFGQNLPVEPLELAERHSKRADLHLVMGSSLTVSPACDMPRTTAKRGGDLVIVNLQPTPLDDMATLKIHAKTDTVAEMLMERLGHAIPAFRLERRLVARLSDHDAGMGDVRATTTREALVTMVDVHDPSLELSLLREVEWPKRRRGAMTGSAAPKVPLAALPVTLHFVGHYHEPALPLVLDFSTSNLLDVQLSYDPYQRDWAVVSQTPLDQPHVPSRMALKQQEHGLSYAQAHFKYVVDGIVKANPKCTKSQCTDAAKTHRQKLLEFVRGHHQSGRGRFVEDEPLSTSSANVRVLRESREGGDSNNGDNGEDARQRAAVQNRPRKVPIEERPGEYRKVADAAMLDRMRAHTQACAHPSCVGLWSGPWGSFVGGEDGRAYFDLTSCAEGSQLNRLVGWNEADPRA